MARRRATALLLGIAVVSSALTTSSAGASGEKSYPEVDITQLTLRDVPAGSGTPQASATVTDPNASGESGSGRALDPGYVEEEFLVQGVASTYTGPVTGPVQVARTGVPYVTRVLVRYPKDASKFSGRVVLEPFNTSGDKDLDAVWKLTAPLLQARGDAWVGVTDRTSTASGLKVTDPVRYADMDVSTNDLAWDILAQSGAAIRKGGPQSPLRGLDPEHLYMAGYSQSGVDTAGFAMAFGERSGTANGKPVYDGYLPASHSASVTPVQAGTSVIPKFETPVMTAVGVPMVDIESQSDVEGFSAPLPESAQVALGQKDYTNVSGASVRRADSDRPGNQFRLYEIAGMPHSTGNPQCEGTPSTFPNAALVRGAFNLLNRWVEDGKAPPKAARMKMATLDTVSKAAVDKNGNPLGGVRSPYLDVPLVRYEPRSPGFITCNLSGREVALDTSVLAKEYTSVSDYMKQFTKGLDAMIRAGYVLPRDRTQLIADQREKATETLSQ